MTSNRRQNTIASDYEEDIIPNETSSQSEDNFKWTSNRERIFLELYDQAIALNNYRFKDPTAFGRDFLVDKFNKEFNLSVNYQFFKKKLDQLKIKYKKYKALMKNSMGISVDPTTSVISAPDSWWKDREVCKIIKFFKRKPPELWDVMQRCFILFDVQSQPQNSVHQRRQELMNEGQNNDEDYETDDGDMQQTQVPETQDNEEVYRVNIGDEMRPSNEFTRENISFQIPMSAAPFQMSSSRVQQRGGVRSGSNSQRGAGNSVRRGNSSQGSRRKQSFERTLTDTMTGFREFQRQSLQQLRPNSFDEDDYNEFDRAVKIFESMELPSYTDFYWACIHVFKEEIFWRKYFIDRAERTVEEKLKFLEALTGYTRDSEYVGERLFAGQIFGSPSSSGFPFGSPSPGGNNSWGQTSTGQWDPGFQQWGATPNASPWISPPNVPQWGTPPNGPQWRTQQNVPQWSSPPNFPQWGTPPNGPQWSSPPNAQQWSSSPHTQQWGQPSTASQWGSSPNAQQWGSSQNAPQYIHPTNIQHGFSLATEVETTENSHLGVSHEKDIPSAENTMRGVSPEFGFTNYPSTTKASRPRRRGGLFNIWGSKRGPNLNETHQSDSTSDN